MTDRVVVSADRKRLLPPHSPEKGYRITREEAAALGLTEAEKPVQERRTKQTRRTTSKSKGK